METKKLTASLTLGVATCALVLSQFAPLSSYLASPHLTLTANRNLQVRHYLGDLVCFPFVQIHNSGKAQGTISKIELVVTKEDNPSYRKTLVAQAYYLKPDTVALNQTPTAIPFGQITVDAGGTWETYIDFYETPIAARRLQAADIQARVAADIQEGLAQRLPFSNELAEISDELFEEIKSSTDERLQSFESGEYILKLRLFADNNSDSVTEKCYSLTVFQGHLSILDAITDGYRYGAGISFPPAGSVGFIVDLFDTECGPQH